jgi:hypothetical protein
MKIIYETDIDIYTITVYDKEEVHSVELNIKQYKAKPYIFRLFGFEIKLPFNSRKTIYGGYNKDKFINDLTYFSTFTVDTDKLKIYRRPRVELYSFSNGNCTTIYFLKYEDAKNYAELKAKENNLIKKYE